MKFYLKKISSSILNVFSLGNYIFFIKQEKAIIFLNVTILWMLCSSGEDVNVCQFLGFQCGTSFNTKNSNLVLAHLHQQHNILTNAGYIMVADLMDVSSCNHYRNVTWLPIIIVTDDQHLITAAYLINGGISITCFSLLDISEKFLVKFQLVA